MLIIIIRKLLQVVSVFRCTNFVLLIMTTANEDDGSVLQLFNRVQILIIIIPMQMKIMVLVYLIRTVDSLTNYYQYFLNQYNTLYYQDKTLFMVK